jgi:uncharacterized protein involved in exopolysaccharide biosynthesis
MNEMKYESADDELSIVDVLNFLKRQYKNIILISILSFSLVCVYIFTRPTIYVSEGSLIVGRDIETPDQIKYLYSSEATITPLKNTSIIKISSTNTNENFSKKAVNETIEKIIQRHDEMLIDRKEQSIQLIKATQNDSKRGLIDLINKSSQLSTTKKTGPITTATLTYSGMLKKGLGLGFIGSIFLAFFVAIGLEFIIKIRKTIKAA